MKLKPCPFCGMQSDASWDDTLYPTGIYKVNSRGIDHYIHHLDYDENKHVLLGKVHAVHCAVVYGGCGAEISGDNKEEAVSKWERRV